MFCDGRFRIGVRREFIDGGSVWEVVQGEGVYREERRCVYRRHVECMFCDERLRIGVKRRVTGGGSVWEAARGRKGHI